MVQVDIVWAYAFGATFAAASARQLGKEEKPFNSKWFTFVLLFLAIFFAPSGVYLLWEFPQWETMQVATAHGDIPSWLVAVFGVTNITQGILGYWTTWRLARKGRYWGAHANWMVAWIIFWFILACGWDGTGYQRFLYDASAMGGELWEPGRMMGLEFFYRSNVWWTLVVMAAFFAPMLVRGMVKGIREGAAMDPSITPPGTVKILALFFGAQWVACLGLAVVAAVAVIRIGGLLGHVGWGYLVGLPLCGAAYYFLLFRRNMPMHRIARALYVKEPGE
ncbi:MAG: hypothetical protein JW838_16155 [Spirochaetes bacterium]|nr:hypothetical protein [Spirochaetota bacterium]